jgi:hypothetical protein
MLSTFQDKSRSFSEGGTPSGEGFSPKTRHFEWQWTVGHGNRWNSSSDVRSPMIAKCPTNPEFQTKPHDSYSAARGLTSAT